MLGCSGVGKSTLLRLIAGLDIQGKIQGNIIFHPNIRVAWLPQKDTLYPWLSIIDNVQLENVLFGKKSQKQLFKQKQFLNKWVCQSICIKTVLNYPEGKNKRVVLARVLMQNADLVLLDEPFSALDAISRYQLQNLAHELLKR